MKLVPLATLTSEISLTSFEPWWDKPHSKDSDAYYAQHNQPADICAHCWDDQHVACEMVTGTQESSRFCACREPQCGMNHPGVQTFKQSAQAMIEGIQNLAVAFDEVMMQNPTLSTVLTSTSSEFQDASGSLRVGKKNGRFNSSFSIPKLKRFGASGYETSWLKRCNATTPLLPAGHPTFWRPRTQKR